MKTHCCIRNLVASSHVVSVWLKFIEFIFDIPTNKDLFNRWFGMDHRSFCKLFKGLFRILNESFIYLLERVAAQSHHQDLNKEKAQMIDTSTKLAEMMNFTSSQFIDSTNMAIYEPLHQVGMWGDFKENGFINTSAPIVLEVETKLSSQSEDTSHGTVGVRNKYDQEASKPIDKVLRRLAQNREAARKSRLRKKAYVQQLENSKLRLIQLEQELERAKQQGLNSSAVDVSQLGYMGTSNSGIAAFNIEYGQWVEEQNRQVTELRNALHNHIGEIELRILVDGCLKHYFDLFRMKATAAKADVFYLMSGMWETPAERFFLWIGGFRPSELLKILMPHLETLTEQQHLEVCNLKQSCQQAEDALSQGMDKLQHILAESVATGQLGEGNYLPQLGASMEKFEAIVRFVNQADHLRQETLQQMSRILTTRQAARGLLALGEYFQRLRALSSLMANAPREPA